MSDRSRQEKPREPRLVRRALVRTFVKLIPAALVVVAIVAAILLFLPVFGKPIISLSATEKQDGAELVLQETRDIFQLSSVEYMRKVVFPYDFLPAGLDYDKVYGKLDLALMRTPAYNQNDDQRMLTAIRNYMNADEQSFLTTANLANQTGLSINGVTQPLRARNASYDFLVATVVVRAGFDLANTPFAVPVASPSGSSQTTQANVSSANTIHDWVAVEEQTDPASDKTTRTVRINLPPARIIEVGIEDPIRDQYPFPDINLKPEGWRSISDFIRQHVMDEATSENLLQTARANAARFFRTFLGQSGYDRVVVMADGVEITDADPADSPASDSAANPPSSVP